MDFHSNSRKRRESKDERINYRNYFHLLLPFGEIGFHYFELKAFQKRIRSGFTNEGIGSRFLKDNSARNFKPLSLFYAKTLFHRISSQYLALGITLMSYDHYKKTLTGDIQNTGIFRKFFSHFFP